MKFINVETSCDYVFKIQVVLAVHHFDLCAFKFSWVS